MKRNVLQKAIIFIIVFAAIILPNASFASSIKYDSTSFDVMTPFYSNIARARSILSINYGIAKITGIGVSNANKYITIRTTLLKGSREIVSLSNSGYGSVSVERSYPLVEKGAYQVKTVVQCGGESTTVYSQIRYR